MKLKEEIFEEAFKDAKVTSVVEQIFFTSKPPTNLVSEYVADLSIGLEGESERNYRLHCSSLRLWWPLRELGMTDEEISEFIKGQIFNKYNLIAKPY